jgi:tellurite methyltransferase
VENPYDMRYQPAGYYWGTRPSALCLRVLELLPPDRPLRLLDIGCGEGRNAVFFARNGYHVSAFDLSPQGVQKTRALAAGAGVPVEVFEDDVNSHRPSVAYDILFSTGVLHYVPPEGRSQLIECYREATRPDGLNAFSVLVQKPFIARAPDAEDLSLWCSGELLTHYRDWRIEHFVEEVFDCLSGGVPHQHAVNRMIARKEPG